MKIEKYKGNITPELKQLLLTADPDESSIEKYIKSSQILVYKMQGEYIGVAVLSHSSDQFELKNIAVARSFQGKGLAKALIAEIKRLARSLGAEYVVVGTGNSSLNQLALYQKCDFRMTHIEKNYFASYPEPIYENGIRCIDRVCLRAPV